LRLFLGATRFALVAAEWSLRLPSCLSENEHGPCLIRISDFRLVRNDCDKASISQNGDGQWREWSIRIAKFYDPVLNAGD
jgi:hypothetical protein